MNLTPRITQGQALFQQLIFRNGLSLKMVHFGDVTYGKSHANLYALVLSEFLFLSRFFREYILLHAHAQLLSIFSAGSAIGDTL